MKMRWIVACCVVSVSLVFSGCSAIVDDQLVSAQQAVSLPAAPAPCQGLYRIPTQGTQAPALEFPKDATIAELPAKTTSGRGVNCTLVVIKGDDDSRRLFWKIQTDQAGFAGTFQCVTEGITSPYFEVKSTATQADRLVYTSVEEQDRVDALLQEGKITATWHRGEHSNSERYERSADGSLRWKTELPLYKACKE